jgi:cytochrome c
MDSMEINKLVGAAVGALLIFLGANFFSELYYEGPEGHGPEEYAYAIDTEEGGAEADTAAEEVDIATLMASADAAKGEKIFGKCKACHKVEPGANSTGPSLYGVVGRPIGTAEGFGYSDTLAGMGGAWNPENLSHFLEKPKDFAPGTKMGFAGLKKPEDRADVIAYLESVTQ